MTFVYEKDKYRLVDEQSGIVITSKFTGVGMDWRRVFEFSGGDLVFCFFAKAMDTSGARIKLSNHWSLDGVARKSATKLIEINVDRGKLAWAFKNIVEALPLFPEYDSEERSYRTLNSVKFDLILKGDAAQALARKLVGSQQ
jgi:hypothetical protein